ncbi:hypothetical protein GIB67_006733 [Kingdonia uniflora]|uniref:Pentatricopeptide repeat-containing protein n=1 Tax=Kingdonia uniflora TaxID=39325 RepID=A0A7J7LYY6_9MAGN|nr:hypothetical protein GIB67_006733 [Kingdonia uniflora]
MKPSFFGVPKYASFIEYCSSRKDLRRLQLIHGKVITGGIFHDDFIRAKLVSSYAACAQMTEAIFIFSCTNRQSTFLYNCLIRGYASLKLFHESLNTYRHMLLAGKQPDRCTLPSVLKSCTGLSALNLGRQLHAFVLIHGFFHYVSNSNALISMYSKCGDLEVACQIFSNMPVRNKITWSAMIAGYGIHGKFNEVFNLLEEMLAARQLPDSVTCTAILMAYSHSGMIEFGRGFFEMMEERFGVKPSLEHYTCMVDMLGRAGHLEEAEALILRMDKEPDGALWRALLGACKMHGKIEVAKRVAEKVYGNHICESSPERFGGNKHDAGE